MPSPASPDEVIRLARKLWGEPTETLRRGEELRFGRHGSKSVLPRQGVWKDHEAQKGGGVKELYAEAGEAFPSQSTIVATYDYCAENGSLLYQVVRRFPHRFNQRRPDPAERDGWAWNLRGVRRVPYRLPQLLAADPTATVWIPEGEKDVDALVGLGLVATCNPEGAGKWRAEFNRYFEGRHVVVLPDNDAVGREHAAQVVRSLRGVAASVVTLALPDLPDKGDVSDWLTIGGTVEALRELAAECRPQSQPRTNGHNHAPPWIDEAPPIGEPEYDGCSDQPETEPQPHKTPLAPCLALHFGEDAAVAPSIQDTVVRGVAHQGSLTLIYGMPKSGKSFLATDLALAVADRERELWMGHRIQRHGPVLYTACEGHGGFWKRLQATGHLVPPHFVLACGRPTLIANAAGDGRTFVPHPDDIQAAVATVRDKLGQSPVMIVIDTVFRAFGSGNVNDSAHMMAFVTTSQHLADAGCAVVCVHHSNKSNATPNGSVSLMGAADTIVKVERAVDNETGATTRTWSIEFAKDDAEDEPRQFELQVIDWLRDAAGELVSSCRVRDLGAALGKKTKAKKAEPEQQPKQEKPLPAHAVTVWMAIRELVAKSKNGNEAIQTCTVREFLLQKGVDQPPAWLRRQIAVLVMHGDIMVSGDDITIAHQTCTE